MDDVYADVPEGMRTFLKDSERAIDPNNHEESIREMWDAFEEGKCMMCRGPLGAHTMIILSVQGICAGFCSGVCLQDMGVIGWLQEQHDDIQDRVKFRGGEGDG